MSVTTYQPRGMNLPSPKPPIVPVTQQNLRDWWALFVNRKAYTQQSTNPHPDTRRHYHYQPKNLRIRIAASPWNSTQRPSANTWPAGSPSAYMPSTLNRNAVNGSPSMATMTTRSSILDSD
jgi:hypothetical protein